ncbi:dihydroorotase [Methanophagales archaeon]|nr:dihydroorotase [Methanophagales archaeon]
MIIEGRIVNRDAIHDAQIAIDDGYITAIRKQGLNGERKIEARECLIFPGFIDLHAHLREDSSHKWDYKEDFKSGTAAALHGGITTVIDMPNTPLPGISTDRLIKKKELARKEGLIDILFYGGVSESNINTIAKMQKEVVAYKIYLAETTGGLYIRDDVLPKAIAAVEATAKPLVIHCEDQRVIEKMHESLKVNLMDHSELRPEEAELSAVKNVLAAASSDTKIKIKIDIAHVSTYRTLDLIGNNFHCEVTPHHLFFTKKDVQANAFLKVNPPLRSEENRLRLLDAFKSGKIDFLVTDHAPHTKAEKAGGLSDTPAGVPNLDTYGNFVAWLIVHCGVSPMLIARACAYNPAMFLGLQDRGSIEVGKRANLSILDLNKRVKIRSERLYTKCKWSPFEGYEFPGAMRHVIYNGSVVMEDDESPI